MCATCGCEGDGVAVITVGYQDHDHPHEHGPEHEHPHEHAVTTLTLEQKVLAKNDELAAANRVRLRQRGILALNMTSSPGAGKTTLIERTIRELESVPVAVIEGDQATMLDARRIEATGCKVVQVNTGAGCHLDADMIRRALDALETVPGSLLFVENVGNLVCPALFDLGEAGKVVIVSVTEGTDKPLKYPHMFAAAELVLINKTDLLPYVDFDLGRCVDYARSVNPDVTILPVSATSGDGLAHWYDWLTSRLTAGISMS
ncbi:hydrogenase nickel incorporation protein HypB [Nocardia sp. NPDC051990]|uniref:hydrogenase nickel incorporation protein HypB n=1 Tax=Nocardia sp. NPDC051990 TaxID=3155285 RepID=UPI00342BA639